MTIIVGYDNNNFQRQGRKMEQFQFVSDKSELVKIINFGTFIGETKVDDDGRKVKLYAHNDVVYAVAYDVIGDEHQHQYSYRIYEDELEDYDLM